MIMTFHDKIHNDSLRLKAIKDLLPKDRVALLAEIKKEKDHIYYGHLYNEMYSHFMVSAPEVAIYNENFVYVNGIGAVSGREIGWEFPRGNDVLKILYSPAQWGISQKIEIDLHCDTLQMYGCDADTLFVPKNEALKVYNELKELRGDYDYEENPLGIMQPRSSFSSDYLWCNSYGIGWNAKPYTSKGLSDVIITKGFEENIQNKEIPFIPGYRMFVYSHNILEDAFRIVIASLNAGYKPIVKIQTPFCNKDLGWY